MSSVFGITPVLDQTAEDVLEQNPRFLTRSKNFATFFAFGPEVITMDEFDSLDDITVSTVVNGEVRRSNRVANMLHSPGELVAFHTSQMPMSPGDIISTGTPGAAVISSGDEVEALVTGFSNLSVAVVDEAR